MSGVRFSGPTNSTFFTTCCNTAICDGETRCPKCKEEVLPYSHYGRWDMAMRALYGDKKLTETRSKYRKNKN